MTNGNTYYTVTDGYSCCGGTTDRGWYAGVYLLRDRDREFTEDIEGTDRKVRLLPGKDFDEWEGTMVDPPRRIAIIDNFGGTPRREIVAEAERIFGPVTVREKTAEPLLVWTELRDGLWRLMVRRGIDSSVVYESTSMLRAPAVTLAGESLFAACETELDGQTGILVMTVSGDILLEIPGGAPELAWAGKLILLSEIKTNDGGIELRLSEIAAGGSPAIPGYGPATSTCSEILWPTPLPGKYMCAGNRRPLGDMIPMWDATGRSTSGRVDPAGRSLRLRAPLTGSSRYRKRRMSMATTPICRRFARK